MSDSERWCKSEYSEDSEFSECSDALDNLYAIAYTFPYNAAKYH